MRARFRSMVFDVALRALFRCMVCLLGFLAVHPLGAQIRFQRPGKEISLPPEAVKDAFFAYVIGVISTGIEVDLTNAELRDILTEFKTGMDLPFDLISSVSMRREPPAAYPGLEIAFGSTVKIPIPYSFLGYHPGSIHASPVLSFSETRPMYTGAPDSEPADAVYVMRLFRGEVLVDVDNWLEWLLPSLIQDLVLETVCIFHRGADWYALLAGTGRNTGDRICQFFNFTRNLIIVPVPRELREFGDRIVASGPYTY